jgi:excisionase family DNA binding protein
MSETIALTTPEAARELKVSVNTLLKWVKQGRVPAVRIGGRKYLFSRIELEKLIAGRKPANGDD